MAPKRPPATKRPALQKRPRLTPARAAGGGAEAGGATGEPALKRSRGPGSPGALGRCVRIQGLHQECTTAEIATLVAPYGEVQGVELEAGCATVEFASAAEAASTVEALGPGGRPPMLGQRVPLVVQRAAGGGAEPPSGGTPGTYTAGAAEGGTRPAPAPPPAPASGKGSDAGRGLVSYDDL